VYGKVRNAIAQAAVNEHQIVTRHLWRPDSSVVRAHRTAGEAQVCR
jgi:hypothetical protein